MLTNKCNNHLKDKTIFDKLPKYSYELILVWMKILFCSLALQKC